MEMPKRYKVRKVLEILKEKDEQPIYYNCSVQGVCDEMLKQGYILVNFSAVPSSSKFIDVILIFAQY